jgi:predicted nucleic acid-binding Zn ribbon protein
MNLIWAAFMDEDKNSMTPLKDVISNLLSDGTLPFNPDDARIWRVWDEVVGPAISRNARPLWIKNGKLKVRVSDPIWLQELKFVEENIKEKLNTKLGRKAVDRIEFRMGPRNER